MKFWGKMEFITIISDEPVIKSGKIIKMVYQDWRVENETMND